MKRINRDPLRLYKFAERAIEGHSPQTIETYMQLRSWWEGNGFITCTRHQVHSILPIPKKDGWMVIYTRNIGENGYIKWWRLPDTAEVPRICIAYSQGNAADTSKDSTFGVLLPEHAYTIKET